MKKLKFKGSISLHSKNKPGFGIISMLLIMSVLITLIGAMAGTINMLERGIRASQEGTKRDVYRQNIFAYVDILVEDEIKRIFDEVKAELKLETKPETEAEGETDTEGEAETETETGNQNLPSEEASEAYLAEFMKKYESKLLVMTQKNNLILKSYLPNAGAITEEMTGLEYYSYTINMYSYDKSARHFKKATAAKGVKSSSELALEIHVKFRHEKKQFIVFSKSYYLNLDDNILDKIPYVSEDTVIGGKEAHYNA